MQSEHADLWRRIVALELDAVDSAFPFSVRLANENGWTHAFARRVIEEYKRFIFLCMTADHVACPSEQVDQAWHLHLVYTRSYWDELCGGVLGRPLHHEPTAGGAAEQARHVRLYERTLASYREAFGEPPPADIWPPSEVRFGDDVCQRRVNVRRHWVVPKPAWMRVPPRPKNWAGRVAWASPLLLLAVNPLDLRGPEFLTVYGVSFVAALVIALVLRSWLRTRSAPPVSGKLSPYELACLAHANRVVANIAVCKMVHEGFLEVEHDRRAQAGSQWQMKATTKPYQPRDRMEGIVYDAVARKGSAAFSDVRQTAESEVEQLETGLQKQGLLETDESFARARWIPFLIMLGLALFGAAKIWVGVSRDKPVGFLVAACVATGVVSLLFLRRPRRTLAGDEVLRDWRQKHRGLLDSNERKRRSSDELALATALFGVAALTGAAHAPLRSAWREQMPGSGGGGGDSSGGSGCGGDGGGGCGGGGCGGCGGGGGGD